MTTLQMNPRTGGGVNPAIDRDFDDHLERVRSTAAADCELIEAACALLDPARPG